MLAQILRSGVLRPVAVVVFFATLLVALPDRNLSLRDARAAAAPACAAGVGVGGSNSATLASTVGGHGCVVIKYLDSGVAAYQTFSYTGADQSWTVPSGVTTINVHLLGAGGGGATGATGHGAGGGGYATGNYSVTAGQVL
ncbi:MAG: hypothetical protein EBQ64_00205, partial [Acidimicrobiia bacterium]|nr:hypothetical protein [Acidimicrobiia bacterium]